MATILEDFEDATLNLTITGDWARTSGSSAFGTWSLKSKTIGANGTTSAEVTVPAGATSLTFYYRVSSELDWDKFLVLVDGATVLTQSGEVAWTSTTLNVTGKSKVIFRYTKDDSFNQGGDAAWVDQLTFTVPDVGTPKAATDSGGLVETTSVAQVPEIPKNAEDAGHLVESRWQGTPQGGTTPPSIRSYTAVAGVSASYTVTAPAGLVANDVLVAIQAADRGDTTNMTAPTGGTTWELLDSLDGIGQVGITQAVRVWWKRAGSGEPGSYTFKQASSSDGVCVIVAVKDASLTAAPILARSTDGDGETITTPGITPAGDSNLELRLIAAYSLGVAMTFTAPAGLNLLGRAQSRVYTAAAAASRLLQSSAATAPADFVASVEDVEWRSGYTLALAPAVSGPPETPKAASDSVTLVESASVVVVPDGIPHSSDDSAALTELAMAEADIASSDAATLDEAPAIDAEPSSADTGTLTEAASLELGWSGTDQAHLTDAGHVDVQAVSADTGMLLELTDVAKTIGPVSNDAAMLTETAGVEAVAAAADAGLLVEAWALEFGQEGADQALLADNAQVEARPAGVDGGALAEAVDLAKTIGPVSSDGGVLAEAAAVDVQVATVDAGALVEAAAAAVVKEAADAAALAETVSIGLDVSDQVALIEQAAVDAAMGASDSAALADAGSLAIPKAAADTAVLVEHAEVIDIGRAIVGVELIRRGWSAHSPRRRWAAGRPRRAWRAESPHT
ncbi:hypothetical protein [Nonomuraea bangladeshensis]|uniref:hypothetical protein n=1 Tax=Nonomuraea bangladeshensis TaxID=404385 RepID=UPI0031E32AAB